MRPRSAFEIYLRTGRRVATPDDTLQLKFNPWHDPKDGRFTFAHHGRYFGGNAASNSRPPTAAFRGGGGRFGGGGAGGSWKPALTAPPVQFRRRGSVGAGGGDGGVSLSSQPTKAPLLKNPGSLATASKSPAFTTQRPRSEQSSVRITKNGYRYDLDAHVRTTHVRGEVRLEVQPRSRRAQANAGKPDRRSSDDGGHYIAARFNGAGEWFNHFAQDANFNRGAYRALEDRWARLVRSGKQVFVEIVPYYHGSSMRPYLLTVSWIVDGEEHFQDFLNERSERSAN